MHCPGHIGLRADLDMLDFLLGLGDDLGDFFLCLGFGDHSTSFGLGLGADAFEKGQGFLVCLDGQLGGFGHGLFMDGLGLFFNVKYLLNAFLVQAILSLIS